MNKLYPVSCNLDCGAGCPLTARVKNGRLVRIQNSHLKPVHASACPVGLNYGKMLYSPDRLTSPLLRTGPRGSGGFKKISWDNALDYAAEKLTHLRETYGGSSLIRLGGSGSCRGALHNTASLTQRFLGLWGDYTNTSGNYSSQATSFAVPFILGTNQAGFDPGTLEHAGMIILWGANIFDVRFGNETARRILDAKKRGVSVVVIDPRRSRSVKHLGTEWVPVFPGTDTLLMAAVLHVLITENRIDLDFINTYSIGFEPLKKYILGESDGIPKTPAWAGERCGTPAQTIISLARRYGTTNPVALIPGLSIQRTLGGEDAARMAVILQTVTGNIGKMGGSSGAYSSGRLPKPRCGRMGVLENTPVSVPVYRFPDAILGGKKAGFPSDIKGIYNVGGNFLSQGSDINKNIRAFNQVAFSICHEPFMTPTARYCDLVLPTTLWPEREDIVFPTGNYLLYSHQAVAPVKGVKNDYDIFCELAERLGFGQAFSQGKDAGQWLDFFIAESEIDDVNAFRETGIFSGPHHHRVGLSEFIANKENNPLNTPSGLIEIASQAYARAGGRVLPLCQSSAPDKNLPLRMISPHPRFRIHSQTGGNTPMGQKDKATVWLNETDAKNLNIRDGDLVAITNTQGRIHVAASVSGDIMEGVVCLLEGAWPDIEFGVDTGGSPNMLTATEPTLPSEGSRTHSVRVKVERIGNDGALASGICLSGVKL
ncbi:MAG: molybdopterin-dependent oxidoreductase [Desulfobacterium sp.]|nr:molybdopterin-dependent oxidoreductase [Desulfobacterium sp.]